ncbi:MAG: hypothetical protein OXB86_02860 [Bdellovibrionales bacterium]|nr:hypothetical protein [Bdellovibrionales bacterium]
MKVKSLLISLFLSAIVFPAKAHEGHSHSHSHQSTGREKELIRTLINQAAALAPEMLHSSQSLALPYITPGRQRVDWDNAGSDMMRNLAKLYRHKLHDSCPFAINENELIKAVPDHIAKGRIATHIKPLGNLVEGGTTTISAIGSKYGPTAAVLKGSAEAIETAVALSTPLKGFHILCEPIDILILFLVRKAQIYGQIFRSSPMLEQNRFASLLRLAWIRRKMIKGLKKALVQLESEKINYESLHRISHEGRKNNRERYVKSVSAKAGKLFSQIREIDSQLEDQNLTPKKRKKLSAKKDKLYRKIAHKAAVTRKEFFGRRYWLSGLMFSRKGKKTHVKGHTFPDSLTSHHWLWPLQVQDIWDRSLVKQAAEEMKAPLRPHLKEDEIRRGLAEEFYDNLPENLRSTNREDHIQSIEYMMGDIERIFDPSLSVEKKHFLSFQTEMLLTSLFEGFIQIINEETSKNLNSRGWFKQLWSKARLNWKHFRFIRHSHIFTDFLMAASLAKDRTALISYKYEAMENFLIFMKYLMELDKIAHSVKTAPAILAALDEIIHPIKAFDVSKKKRTVYSLIPFKNPKPPMCRDLVMEVK